MISMVLGIIRHALTTAGGALVGNGYLTGDELSSAVGAIVTLVGVAWSVYEKRSRA